MELSDCTGSWIVPKESKSRFPLDKGFSALKMTVQRKLSIVISEEILASYLVFV